MAHIPDGFLSAPVLATTAAASAVALATAARRSRRTLAERETPVLGAVTAFVFAAQMLNFPIGAGTSAHLIGGVLVATILGPWSGMLAMFAVVLVQALLFQDGGIAALGANTLNLAVIGAGGGYLLLRWIIATLGDGRRRRLVAAGLSAFATTVMIGAAVAVELAASGTVAVRPALLLVGGAHVLVGVAEAALTVGILGAVLRLRPDLVSGMGVPTVGQRQLALGIAMVAATLAGAAGYVASTNPDVLEWAAARLGLSAQLLPQGPFASYTSPVGGAWVAGVVGVAVVFAAGWFLARTLDRPRRGLRRRGLSSSGG
jgi:cobalt/nickel transport system permease protein